jgi:hypothetical protein
MTNILFLRYLLIDYRLRKVPHASIENLRDFIENELKLLNNNSLVSKSTIKTDLKNMREFFLAEVSFNFNKGEYGYQKSHFSFMQLPDFILNRLIIQLKLQISLNESFNIQPRVDFDNGSAIFDYENLCIFINAIAQKRVMEIIYKAKGAKRSRRYELDILLLKQYKGGWFLIAKNIENQMIKTFDIKNIIGVPVITCAEIKNGKTIDAEKHFDSNC